MFYVYEITVPKSTPRSDPLIYDLELDPGEIHQVGVGFKWGPAGLAHAQIWRAEHQVWPSNPGGSFTWNDHYYVFDESEECAGPTEHWSIRAWNLDTRHDHDVQVSIGILPKEKTVLGKVAQSLFGGR